MKGIIAWHCLGLIKHSSLGQRQIFLLSADSFYLPFAALAILPLGV